MWKHLVVRTRRFIHTPIEIFSPLIFLLVLFCFKEKIRSTGPPSLDPGLQENGYEIRHTVSQFKYKYTFQTSHIILFVTINF